MADPATPPPPAPPAPAPAPEEHGLPPRKELLEQHNVMLARKDALRRERAARRASEATIPRPETSGGDENANPSATTPNKTGAAPASPTPSRPKPRAPPSSVGGETTKSKWDEATVEECWAFIKAPHTGWASAAKGMDITDVAPTWRKARSEIGTASVYAESVATDDGTQSVASKAARSTATSPAPKSPAVGPPRRSSLSSLKQARQQGAAPTHTPDLSLSIGGGSGNKRADAAVSVASNISTPTSVGRPSGISGAARRGKLSKPPVNGYSHSPAPSIASTDMDMDGLLVTKPATNRAFTNSNRPRPAPRPGRMAQ